MTSTKPDNKPAQSPVNDDARNNRPDTGVENNGQQTIIATPPNGVAGDVNGSPGINPTPGNYVDPNHVVRSPGINERSAQRGVNDAAHGTPLTDEQKKALTERYLPAEEDNGEKTDEGAEPADTKVNGGGTADNKTEDKAGKDKSSQEGAFYDMWNRNTLEDDATRKKREKREKLERAIAALGDLATGIINLGTSAAGGLSTWDGRHTLSGAVMDRINEENDLRKKDYNAYFDRYIQEKNMTLRERQQQLKEQQAKANEKYDEKMRILNLQLMQGKIDAQKFALEESKARLELTKELDEARINSLNVGAETKKSEAESRNKRRENQTANDKERTAIAQQKANQAGSTKQGTLWN